jgi:arylsulfatase A-like enzyme
MDEIHRSAERRQGPAATRRGILLGAGAAAAGARGARAAVQPTRRPNIVFMLVDNLGYGDLSCYAGPIRGVLTPRLDQLAREGLQLTNFNTEPECTPSRSALMTGRMPVRSGTSTVLPFGSKDGLAPWEYTLAELLSEAGYATACYGKWHLGSSEGRFPTNQGFDEWYGIARSSGEVTWSLQPDFDPAAYHDQPVYEGRRGEPSRPVATYDFAMRGHIDHEITRRAVNYIEHKAGHDRPFFLYVPFTLPHFPPLAHPDFVKPGRTQYQNVLDEIDHNAGQVLDAIDRAGLREDTIVVFASDNGPETMEGVGIEYGAQADTGPFRFEFPSAWEGAIRTACLIRWPGRTRPGRVSNEIVTLLDFYRTLARAAGAHEKVPTDRAMDSIDLSDFLFGGSESSPRDHVMYFYRDDLLAVKWRHFKIHLSVREQDTRSASLYGQNLAFGARAEPNYAWIFNVDADPKELWDIAATNGWLMGGPLAKVRRDYADSVRRFPNILPGEDRPRAL